MGHRAAPTTLDIGRSARSLESRTCRRRSRRRRHDAPVAAGKKSLASSPLTSATAGPPSNRTVRPGAVLATVCGSLTAITVNISLLNVGLPTLSRDLHASNVGIEWIVDGYALVFAAFLLTAGSLGDRIGRRLVLMTGLAVFGGFSASAALVSSSAGLIAARAGMGLGAALVMPMTLSILTDIYPTEAGLRRAIGIWAATASAGAVIAPLLGGVLLSHFWWGSLFVVNVPLAIGLVIAAGVTVPNSAPRRHAPTDWPGVILSIAFPAGLVFALIEGPQYGWSSPLVVAGFAATAAGIGGFVLRELRATDPLIDVRCFRLPRFSIGCGVVALQYLLSFGQGFLVTQYLQLVLGYSALSAGVILMPAAVGVMVAAPWGARAFGRYGPRAMTTLSLGIAAVGALLLTAAGVHASLVLVIGQLLVSNLAIGLMSAGTTSMVMSAVPPERAGMASGTQSTTRQLGRAVGVAVVGTLLAARYSSALSTLLPGTAAAGRLHAAQRSLAAALSDTSLSGHAHEVLAELSRTAFVDGMHLATLVLAGVAAVAAISVAVLLREPAPAAAAGPAAGTMPVPAAADDA